MLQGSYNDNVRAALEGLKSRHIELKRILTLSYTQPNFSSGDLESMIAGPSIGYPDEEEARARLERETRSPGSRTSRWFRTYFTRR
jgi:hypothetical protein